MKTWLELEDAVFLVLALMVFSQLAYSWWQYATLFLLPDISMIGYGLKYPDAFAHVKEAEVEGVGGHGDMIADPEVDA